MMLKMPTRKAAKKETLADVLAAEERVAPMRFATRVDAAMEMGNGIWKVIAEMVLRIDCAARWVVLK